MKYYLFHRNKRILAVYVSRSLNNIIHRVFFSMESEKKKSNFQRDRNWARLVSRWKNSRRGLAFKNILWRVFRRTRTYVIKTIRLTIRWHTAPSSRKIPVKGFVAVLGNAIYMHTRIYSWKIFTIRFSPPPGRQNEASFSSLRVALHDTFPREK